MADEDSNDSNEPEKAPLAEEEASATDGGGESPPEKGADPPAQEPGQCSPEQLDKLRPVCAQAEQNYSQVLGLIKEIKASENVLQRFHAREAGVSPQDVEEAKKRFDQAKQSYIQLGNQINDGIKQVFDCAKTCPEDYLVQDLYRVYLAKLLASLETRNPIQPFVETIATEGFDFDRQQIVLTEAETQRGQTTDALEAERLEEIKKKVTMLTTRYQKRQLANRLRQGEEPKKIIEQLLACQEQDPDDINTHIWLASLLSNELKKEKDQNKHLAVRNQILENCQRAFGNMDDYLNLQGIENLSVRDKLRSEYLKTITAIRKPLLDGTG